MFHPPGVVSGFENFTMMREAVEHGGGHLLIAEDLWPFSEGVVGCPNRQFMIARI